MTPSTLTTAIAVITFGLGAGCSSRGASDTTADPFAAAASGLCEATQRADDPGQARRVFFDAVHQPLHQLADQAATVDRGAAAALLEAKQGLEAAFGDDGTNLAPALDRLVGATDTALAVLDRPGLACGGDQ